MDDSIDVASSSALAIVLVVAFISFAIASASAGHVLSASRVEREHGLPIVGHTPMHAVYRAIVPIGRGLVFLGVSANAVTLFSLVVAFGASVLFAFGHFGFGAALAVVAALADVIDGIVARESHTASHLGQVLDTTVDRYVDAMLLGGLAIYVRQNVILFILVLGAIVGSFMVSYASSIERELSVKDMGGSIPMRRAHRLAYLLIGAALGPFAARAADRPEAAVVPILVAAAVIAVVGNVSAVRRLLIAAHSAAVIAAPSPPPPRSEDSSPRALDAASAPPLSQRAPR